ncbi:hypothetical protein A5828_001753 [Enterococcus faecium]|nr:hypothetical protein A5828_001753 [Enterococcus faecium]
MGRRSWVCEININIIRITNTFPIREFFSTIKGN